MANASQTKNSSSGNSKEHGSKEHGESQAQRGFSTRPRHEMASPGMGGSFRRLREEVDQLFDQFFGGWGWPMAERGHGWGFDIQQEDGMVKVRAEAPGFEPDDFDIQVRGDSLVLCACHQSENGDEKNGGHHEWSRREFSRTIPLPSGVNVQNIDATYRQGILTVTLPISEEFRPRRIAVKG